MRLGMKGIWLVGALGIALASVAQADQGKMREALRELRQARQELEQVGGHKGGHRTRALEHIDKAISHVQEGIAVAEEND